MKYMIVFSLILLIMLGCQHCNKCSSETTSKENSDSSNKYTTDNASFDAKTGEFIADKYTVALLHCNDTKDVILMDDSKETNHGFLEGIPKWTKGFLNNGLKLDGRRDYVEIQNKDSLNPSRAITLEILAFVETQQFNGFPALFSKDTLSDGSGQPTFELYFSNDSTDKNPGMVCWRITTDSGETNMSSDVQWKTLGGDWHYFAATYNGKEMRLYIDGKLAKSQPKIGALTKNDRQLRISRKWNPTNNFFHGIIDEIRISNIARSEKAIKQYWQNLLTRE